MYIGKTSTVDREAQSSGLIAPEFPWEEGILKLHSKGTAMPELSACLASLLLSSSSTPLLLLPEGMLVGATDTEGRKLPFLAVQRSLKT